MQDKRYAYESLNRFATQALVKSGLPSNRAVTVAEILIEGDLLGYRTHGLNRLLYNVEQIRSDQARVDRDPIVLKDHSAAFSWDADMLPGPFVVASALEEACRRASIYGVSAATIRRSDHIACLASYLPQIVERGFSAMIMASTPAERVMVSPQGIKPVLSSNPIAFGAPAEGDPIIIDMSTGAMTMGAIAKAREDGVLLEAPVLRAQTGELTSDPEAFFEDPPAGIMPFGGDHASHKGFIICLMIEILSSMMNGYGPDDAHGEGEANAVFLQVFDPKAFSGTGEFQRQIELLRNNFSRDSTGATRMPGSKSWKLRTEQKENGVFIGGSIFSRLKTVSRTLGVDLPQAL